MNFWKKRKQAPQINERLMWKLNLLRSKTMASTPPEKFLNDREQVIIQHSWRITRAEKVKLDHFFLVKTEWSILVDQFTYDDENLVRFLNWEGREYVVNCLLPVRRLRVAPLLGLSFRVHKPLGIAVVLVNEWVEEET